MHIIIANNVRDALPKAVKYIIHHGVIEKTRLGDAWVAPMPVTIKYYIPKQHVLINQYRDANPFFHLMEAMWMLAGRDDGVFLDYYIKDFSKSFGTNGRIMDAYGYRWRYGLEYNQLAEIITQLKKDPTSRQAVLQMWGAGRNDLIVPDAKPCNLVVTFRIRNNLLDMTVFNRSNDLIWGCCGANAVHFALLQEYMAGMIGVKMGAYYQISNNLHLYKDHYEMITKRISFLDGENLHISLWSSDGYESTQPLIEYPESFNEELIETMDFIDSIHNNEEGYGGNIANKFLRTTVIPMAVAHGLYKNKNIEAALEAMRLVEAKDWQRAGTDWLKRRTS